MPASVGLGWYLGLGHVWAPVWSRGSLCLQGPWPAFGLGRCLIWPFPEVSTASRLQRWCSGLWLCPFLGSMGG